MSNIQLIHGDCLIEMQTLEDKSIDLILCDLPYGMTACKWDTCIDFKRLWEQYTRIIKDNGAIVLFASQPFTSLLVTSNIKMFKYEWIWLKDMGSNFVTAKSRPFKEHESVLVFAKGLTKYNPIMQERGQASQQRLKYKGTTYHGEKRDFISNLKDANTQPKRDSVFRYPSSYQYFKVPNHLAGTLHPTQKPVDLLEYLIKTYTDEGDMVLDNCMGSGSTGVACQNLNRKFIGIEKDDKYFEIAKNRLNKENK